MIEIARYAFERLGDTIRYEKVTWARAIHETREGRYDGIVGAGREETPGFVFPAHGLGRAVHVF